MEHARAGAIRRHAPLVKYIQGAGRRLCALFCALALTAALLPAAVRADGPEEAAAPQTLQSLTEAFLQQYGLSEERFSFGYYNTLTGEEYYIGGDRFFVGGSIYKLPLNMLYVEMLEDGRADPDRRIAGYSYPEIQRLSIQYSNNELSQALRRSFSPDTADYRAEIVKFSGLQPDELPDRFLHENLCSPRFMIGTLQYLYGNADRFADILGYMKLAHPGRYLGDWDSPYEIAHKYGYFEGQLNDVAIVYTPEPFFLVVFTHGVYEKTLGEFCRMMTEYTLAGNEQYRLQQARAEADAEAAASAAAPPEAPSTEDSPASERSAAAWYAAGGGAVVLLGLAAVLCFRQQRGRHCSH